MKLTELSLRRPVTSFMVFTSLVVIGLISARLLPLEYFPDISFPGAYIQIPYNNSTPEEIERNITRPVEEALATMNGIELMNSTSGESQTGIFVQFSMGTDMDLKSIEIREKIDGIRDELPSDLQNYFVFRFSAQDQPMMNLRISSDRDLAREYDLLNRNLKLRIERIPGVGRVDLYGVEKNQVKIELKSDRLVAHNIYLNDLVEQLDQANFSLSAGKVIDAGVQYNIRPIGELSSAEEIGRLVIGPDNLRLNDIADVTYEPPVLDYGRHLDMKYAVGFDVLKESGANTVEVAEKVLEEIEEVSKMPEMTGIRVFEMNNQADGIISSLKDLFSAGMIGALLSVFVLYLFLRQFATTLIVALAVPFSLVVTLGILYFMGLSLNILSMMGLMLAIGMLVDNAVVVTENIHRNQLLKQDKKEASVTGTKQVAMAVSAGTLTSIIVFLPNIISESSMIAVQLYHVAITIIIALSASLLISLTIIPLLASRLKPVQNSESKTYIDTIIQKYGQMLGWLIRHKRSASAVVILTFLSVMVPSQLMTVEMFPRVEERELYLHYNLNDSFVLERVKETVDKIEQYLYNHQDEFEIESVYSYYTSDFAQSTILLKEDDNSRYSVSEIKKKIEENLPKIVTGEPAFEYLNRNVSDETRVFVIGESSDVLEGLTSEAIRLLKMEENFSDVRSDAETGRDEIQVQIDRVLADRHGINSMDAAQVISGALRGRQMRKIRGEQSEIDVLLSFRDSDRQTLEDLQNLPIRSDGSGQVKLASIADIDMKRSPRSIVRENRQTSSGILINLDGITTDEARGKIEKVMNGINYPAGYGWSYGRSFQQDQEAMDEMLINMLLALMLIYLVMAALFESVLFPSSIITSVFFAIIGVIWFFFVTGTTFSFMAMIGILILMGIVVNNGIVLIDHINQLRNNGMNRTDAIIKGGMDRFRPILMTAATTVLGLIPLCIGNTQIGGDGPPYFPMARAIVGGLTFSTIITLVFLPTIYILLDDLKRWSVKLWLQAAP